MLSLLLPNLLFFKFSISVLKIVLLSCPFLMCPCLKRKTLPTSHEIKHYYKRETYFIAMYKRGNGINGNISGNLRRGGGLYCRWTRLSSRALRGRCWSSGATLTVNTAGAAVERVVDEEVTVHTEDAVARWTAEDLRTQTGMPHGDVSSPSVC